MPKTIKINEKLYGANLLVLLKRRISFQDVNAGANVGLGRKRREVDATVGANVGLGRKKREIVSL